MAKFCINDYIDLGTQGYHNATSWEVALDPEFIYIIDFTYKNTVNVKCWNSMLPKLDGSGYYADLDRLYARCKVWIDDFESEWFVCEPKNQNDQKYVITEEGKENIIVNGLELGIS